LVNSADKLSSQQAPCGTARGMVGFLAVV